MPDEPPTSPVRQPPEEFDSPATAGVDSNKQGNITEYTAEIQLNERGQAEVTTPKLFGYLEVLHVNQSMKSRVYITNADDPEEVLFDFYPKMNEDFYIRSRTCDAWGRFFDTPTKFLINYPLHIKIQGASMQSCEIKIILNKP